MENSIKKPLSEISLIHIKLVSFFIAVRQSEFHFYIDQTT